MCNSNPTRLPHSGLSSFGLIQRIVLLAALFSLELVVISVCWDEGRDGEFRHWGAPTLRFVVVSAALLASVGYVRARSSLQQILAGCVGIPVDLSVLLAHFLAMTVFGLLSARLFRNWATGLQTSLVGAIWFMVGMLAITLAALAFAPANLWWRAFRLTGNTWVYAITGGFLSCLLGKASQLLWAPAAGGTFFLVRTLLRPLLAGITADPTTHTVGTSAFAVEIAPSCSGLEGAGLMVVTGGVWLLVFRRDFRFPQAFLLIPAGVAALYLLNAVRIAALVLIGHAGAPGIATRGFHSQAGWIAFIAVALGLSLTARRLPWLAVTQRSRALPPVVSGDSNTAYLVPFLAILVTGMISRAASAEFEWLYPLRLCVAAALLWHYRSEYSRLDWRFGWASPILGTAAFLVWLLLDSWFVRDSNSAEAGLALAAASPLLRNSWIVLRVLAAVITVPIAEELAFRGFLLRRIVSPAFISVKPQSVTMLAVLISSLAFGALHGDRWLAGTIAGLLYALAFLRQGKISDAIAAHATTNALLAGYVVLWSKWSMW